MSSVNSDQIVKYYTFQVISGEHQGKTRTYKKGDIFRSKHPLDLMFTGKFVRLPDSPLPPDDEAEGLQNHLEGFASENKAPVKPEMPIAQPEVEKPFDFGSATNVTHMFPVAKSASLVVYRDTAGGFAVAEEGVQNPVNLADSILPSKKAVNTFLKDFETEPDDGKQD